MRQYLGFHPALLCVFPLALLTLAFIQPPAVSQPKPVAGPVVTHYPGRVVQVQSNALHRLNHPVVIAPRVFPPTVPAGHHWRWSSIHARWIALPVAVSPNAVVLPNDFALPANVTAFEPHADCTLVCPHCQQTITVGIK